MNCAFVAGWNIADLIMCTLMGLGIPLDVFALGVLAAFTLFALWARIDYNISLGFAAILSYILMMIVPGSLILPTITGLLAIGVGARVLIGFIAMLRQ